MILKFFLILILINTVKCHEYTEKNYALNAVLKDTSNFFGKLKLDYGMKFLTIK